ncbi:MAG: nucleoside deaminase [Candidatus Tectomicrobia bacterium]|nr:nucleoside deaminase [Candidatus Tectomicrobia bacterium]
MANLVFMRRAIVLSEEALYSGQGGPFGALIVKDDRIISEGLNRVTSNNDPTAHAEIVAIREACRVLNEFHLHGCEIYTSCEPCPMCLSAIYWARVQRIYYANTRHDAADIGFDDEFLYREIPTAPKDRTIPASQLLAHEARQAFDNWQQKVDKRHY